MEVKIALENLDEHQKNKGSLISYADYQKAFREKMRKDLQLDADRIRENYLTQYLILQNKIKSGPIYIKMIRDDGDYQNWKGETEKRNDWSLMQDMLSDYTFRPCVRDNAFPDVKGEKQLKKYVHATQKIIDYDAKKHALKNNECEDGALESRRIRQKIPKDKEHRTTPKLSATLVVHLKNKPFGVDDKDYRRHVGFFISRDAISKMLSDQDIGTVQRGWIGSEKTVEEYALKYRNCLFKEEDFSLFMEQVSRYPHRVNEVLIQFSRNHLLAITITNPGQNEIGVTRKRFLEMYQKFGLVLPVVHYDYVGRAVHLVPLEKLLFPELMRELNDHFLMKTEKGTILNLLEKNSHQVLEKIWEEGLDGSEDFKFRKRWPDLVEDFHRVKKCSYSPLSVSFAFRGVSFSVFSHFTRDIRPWKLLKERMYMTDTFYQYVESVIEDWTFGCKCWKENAVSRLYKILSGSLGRDWDAMIKKLNESSARCLTFQEKCENHVVPNPAPQVQISPSPPATPASQTRSELMKVLREIHKASDSGRPFYPEAEINSPSFPEGYTVLQFFMKKVLDPSLEEKGRSIIKNIIRDCFLLTDVSLDFENISEVHDIIGFVRREKNRLIHCQAQLTPHHAGSILQMEEDFLLMALKYRPHQVDRDSFIRYAVFHYFYRLLEQLVSDPLTNINKDPLLDSLIKESPDEKRTEIIRKILQREDFKLYENESSWLYVAAFYSDMDSYYQVMQSPHFNIKKEKTEEIVTELCKTIASDSKSQISKDMLRMLLFFSDIKIVSIPEAKEIDPDLYRSLVLHPAFDIQESILSCRSLSPARKSLYQAEVALRREEYKEASTLLEKVRAEDGDMLDQYVYQSVKYKDFREKYGLDEASIRCLLQSPAVLKTLHPLQLLFLAQEYESGSSVARDQSLSTKCYRQSIGHDSMEALAKARDQRLTFFHRPPKGYYDYLQLLSDLTKITSVDVVKCMLAFLERGDYCIVQTHNQSRVR